MDSPGSASPASPAPGAAPGGGLAAKPAFNELEDALPPSLRTAKLMMKFMGPNKAGREACRAIASDERLTRAQKKALCRMGRKAGVPDDVMISMLKQSDTIGVTPMELEALQDAAKAAQLSKDLVEGYGWMAAENAGPGTISVLLEAQSLLHGQEQTNPDALRVLRNMIFGRKTRPLDMAVFICLLTGTQGDKNAEQFWMRFARDVLAQQQSHEAIVLQQLLLGRGVGWWSATKLPETEQFNVIRALINDIESGKPPREPALPDKDDLKKGAALMQEAFNSPHINFDDTQMRVIFKKYDGLDVNGEVTPLSGLLTPPELVKVIHEILNLARDGSLQATSDRDDQAMIREGFSDLSRYYLSEPGAEEIQTVFDPNGDDPDTSEEQFITGFFRFVRQLQGIPEPEPETGEEDDLDPEPESPGDISPGSPRSGGASPRSPRSPRTGDVEADEKALAKAIAKEDKLAAKKQKKKEARAKKEMQKAEAAKQKAAKNTVGSKEWKQANGVEDSSSGGILAPRGAKEFLSYLAGQGRDAPKSLASLAYICVQDTEFNADVYRTFQFVVTDTELDKDDVATLLGVVAFPVKNLKSDTAEFRKLTNAAWVVREKGRKGVQKEFLRLLLGYCNGSDAEPLILMCEDRNYSIYVQQEAMGLGMLAERVPDTKNEADSPRTSARKRSRRLYTFQITKPEEGFVRLADKPAEYMPSKEIQDFLKNNRQSGPGLNRFDSTPENPVGIPKNPSFKSEDAVAFENEDSVAPEGEETEKPLEPAKLKPAGANLMLTSTDESEHRNDVAATLTRLALTDNSEIAEYEATALYLMARECKLNHKYIGALDALFVGGWPDSAIEQFENPAPKSKGSVPKKSKGGKKEDEGGGADADGGMSFENPVAEEVEEVEEEVEEEEDNDEQIGNDNDEKGGEEGGGAEADAEGGAETETEPEATDGDVTATESELVIGVPGELEDGENDDGAKSPNTMEMELRKFAAEFSPDHIMATTNSLVGLLLRQREHVGTISAFQSLIEKTYPSPAELEALHVIADMQGIDPEVVEAVSWLWCNGQGAPEEVSMQMVDWDTLGIERVPAPPVAQRFSLDVDSVAKKMENAKGEARKARREAEAKVAEEKNKAKDKAKEAKAKAKEAKAEAKRQAKEAKKKGKGAQASAEAAAAGAKEKASAEATAARSAAETNPTAKDGALPGMPGMPGVPEGMPAGLPARVPEVPAMPGIPATPAMPGMPTAPVMPGMPTTPGMLGMPAVPGIPGGPTAEDSEAATDEAGEENEEDEGEVEVAATTWDRGLELHPDGVKGKLMLTIRRASNLINVDSFGKSDPMVTVRVEGHQRNTNVEKNNLNPVWDMEVSYMITDRTKAIVECTVSDTDRNGGVGNPLGCVTFPLGILDPGQELTMSFDIEPDRGMKERAGELGELEISMLFMPSEVQPEAPAPIRSTRLETMFEAIQEMGVNIDALDLAREATNILIDRTIDELKYIQPPTAAATDFVGLQREAFAEGPEVDMMYSLEEDLATEGKMTAPMRQKHRTAISFILSKIFDFNPALLGIIESTIPKFAPLPEVTGSFAAAVLGTIGMPEKALAGIKNFLRDRLTEEMEKLLSCARGNDEWFNALAQICRGKGAAAACVDYANEVVAVADSFSTSAALYRLNAGVGPASFEEAAELESVVESDHDDIVTAAFQNLHRLIWPSREESFDKLRELVDGNEMAEAGLWGVEARAELALICNGDEVAYDCIKALIACEELRAYLVLKEKKLEVEGLDKLLDGDKNAINMMKKLTPSIREKLHLWWQNMNRWGKIKVIFAGFFGGLLVVMWLFKKSGLERTLVGKAFEQALTMILYVATMFLGVLAGVWFVLQGAPLRDKVKGPHSDGILMLHKLTLAADDKEAIPGALDALQQMLMGQEPNVTGKSFLRKRAAKYFAKAPEATEALNCLEYMFVLQQLGKDAAEMDEAQEHIPWPSWSEIYPPTSFKLREARGKVWEKFKHFFFFAKVNPIMKAWAKHSGEKMSLYNSVEVSLTMCKDNAEEFAALDNLRDGNRVNTDRLRPLQDMVDDLCRLDKNGSDPTSLQEAMRAGSRTGNVAKVFGELDADDSGNLDYGEAEEAIHRLADSVGFSMTPAEIEEAFLLMDEDGSGEVDIQEFTTWWTGTAVVNKQEKKMLKMQQMEAAGLLPESPKPKELKLVLKVLTNLLPTIGLRLRTFETLEDMCPDDDTFEALQEAFYLCELKRMMIQDRSAYSAILGLEAICMLPKLLDGDPDLGIPPNEAAKDVVDKVQRGDKAALAAKEYIKQPEYRRVWGMMTQRQRRGFMIVVGIFSLPILHFSGFLGAAPSFSELAAGFTVNVTDSDSGSWEMAQPEPEAEPEPEPEAGYVDDRGTSPSFYVLGLLPLASSVFVSFFGQRIASLITLITVFTASAGATISAALADRDPEADLTPSQFVGVGMGVYAGSIAVKVASGNIKFAYGVQGASVGAMVSRFSTTLWRPKLLWLIPELCMPPPKECYIEWVDLAVAGIFGVAAAWISNTYRGLISILATAIIGVLAFVQTATAYGIPGIDNFTIDKLMSNGISCGDDEDCFNAMIFLGLMLFAGTFNQFKMAGLDLSIPPVTAYERFIQKVEKAMTLIFAISEFIEGGVDLDTGELMERCLAARDKLVKYMNIATSCMHFGLCFGFAVDFYTNLTAGIYAAVPWAGAFSLLLALVTPIQGVVGLLAGILCSPKFNTRIQEFVVPGFMHKIVKCIPIPALRDSYIVKFGPIGQKLQQLSFYIATFSTCISVAMGSISYLTSSMYAVYVRADWDNLQLEMPGMSLPQAIGSVSATIAALGDSAMGLLFILGSGLYSAAYDMGGMSWLITNIVSMERHILLACGGVLVGMSIKLGLQYPPTLIFFFPMGMIGVATFIFGLIKAIPFFEKKFPDLMHMLHRAQIVLSIALSVIFIGFTHFARNIEPFVTNNWEECQYPDVCPEWLVGNWAPGGTSSLKAYAADMNLSLTDLVDVLTPIAYGCATAALMTAGVISGGSNLAKFMYYKNVMSRKEEIAALRNGGTENVMAMRQDALVKKVRKQRDHDISAVASSMSSNVVTDLEEKALMMEFATAVAMERHYDLYAHDEMAEQIDKSSSLERLAGDPARGVKAIEDDPDDGPIESGRQGGAFAGVKSGVQETGATLEKLARQSQTHMPLAVAVEDDREIESCTIEARMQGAKVLVDRTRDKAGVTAWDTMNIFAKREAAYSELEVSESGGGIAGLLPVSSMGSLFKKSL